MKKRYLVLIISMMIMIAFNSLAVFAASDDGDYEDITGEEYTYDDIAESDENASEEEDTFPPQLFNDTSIPGIIIEANVEEGIFPAQTSIRTKLVSSEVEEQVRSSIETFFNGDQKAVKITAVDIGFVYSDMEIDPKGTITIIMRSDTVLEGANHVVICLKDDQADLLPASQSVIDDDYALNEEGISLRKKEFSFELNGNATIAIVEIEDVPADQKKTETPTDQNETGKTEVPAEQSETGKTEVPAEQSETGKTEVPAEQSETGKTEVPAEQNETGKTEVPAEQKETGKTEVPAEQKETGKTEVPAEQKETEKNEKTSDNNETKKTESSSNQKKAEDSADKNEKIKVSVEIVFDDNNNQDGMRPQYREVVLKSNGVEKSKIRINEQNNWKGSFENLPKYEEGKEVNYEVEVATPYPYERVSNNSASTNNLIYKFKHEPEKIHIEGQIKWEDAENKAEKRPETRTISLFGDDVKVDSIETSGNKGWKYDFGDYPKFKNGKKISYKIKTDNPDGYYEPEYKEFNVIYKITDEPETENKVEKVKVGDKKNIIFWIVFLTVLLFASGFGIFLFIKKEDEEHEEYEDYEDYEE